MSTRRVRSDRMLERTAAAAASRSRARALWPCTLAVAEAPATVNDVAASSWTGPSCRLAAIRRRSSALASTARWSSSMCCSSARRRRLHQRPHEGRHDDDEEQEAARGDPGEAAPQLGGALADRVVGRVQLEQGGLLVRGPDRAVDLERTFAVLEGVLGGVQVGHVGHGLLPVEGTTLLLAQREGAPDELALVGVEHPAVGAPHLDPHDLAGTEQLVVHHLVERRDGGRVPGEQARR